MYTYIHTYIGIPPDVSSLSSKWAHISHSFLNTKLHLARRCEYRLRHLLRNVGKSSRSQHRVPACLPSKSEKPTLPSDECTCKPENNLTCLTAAGPVATRNAYACCHVPPFSQALIAALYGMVSCSTADGPIAPNSAKSCCHFPPFSQALIAALIHGRQVWKKENSRRALHVSPNTSDDSHRQTRELSIDRLYRHPCKPDAPVPSTRIFVSMPRPAPTRPRQSRKKNARVYRPGATPLGGTIIKREYY